MGFIEHFSMGYNIAVTPANLLFCFLGVFFGTLVGVLPGIGAAAAISLLLPLTFGMNPVSAIIMLAGIYYGAQYGGSITSILVNIPGEASTVITCLDGYQMARQGRAGAALGIAAFGSFIAGTLSILPMIALAELLSTVAISFGPPEYFALIVVGLTLLINLAQGSALKGFIMALLGVGLSQIGMDMITGATRLTYGSFELQDGIGLIPVVMGFFGISEILANLETPEEVRVLKTPIRDLFPNWEDWKNSLGPIMRGTVLGFFLGLLPGCGGVLASFSSYLLEKRVSKHPERFGHGAIEGVAGPESANNAASQTHFVPLFILGLPTTAVMGILMGAMMIHNIAPGPFFLKQHPGMFYGTMVSMYVGNVMLLVLNLPMVPFWVQLLKVPYRILFPLILLFCVIGVFSVDYKMFDIFAMVIFAVIGYFLKKFKYELAPCILAFLLGPMAENSLRQSLLISDGSFLIFVSRPITVSILTVALIVVLSSTLLPFIRKQKKAFIEGAGGA